MTEGKLKGAKCFKKLFMYSMSVLSLKKFLIGVETIEVRQIVMSHPHIPQDFLLKLLL